MSELVIPTRIQSLHVPAGRRILAVGDIHGHRALFAGLLRGAGFCSNDILVIVGDMIQKGPDSLGTLQYVMELAKGRNVYPLMGNVDAYVLRRIHDISPETYGDFYNYTQDCLRRYGSSFYLEMAAACGKPIRRAEDVLTCKEEILTRFAGELSFLAGLPTVLETENFVFVHGGLREKNVADNLRHGMFALTKYDGFAAETPHVFEKYVVVGHYPVSLYRDLPCYDPLIRTDKRIISIDGGCGIKYEGQLNLFIIPDINCEIGQTRFLSRDTLPTVTALADQDGAEGSIFINWLTRQVEVLEEGTEFTLIRHSHSGKTLRVPSGYIYSGSTCRDYSDNVLAVKRGNRLGLVLETSEGILAKRGGTVGWYFGAYR